MHSIVKTGVALSSGGAAGMAHVGVLEELEEAGIAVHCVAGTSAGAMVGAAYVAGHLTAFRDTMSSLTRRRVFALFDPVWPHSGLFEGRRPIELIRPYVGDRIETLPRPYAAVATDLRSGKVVTLRHGSVAAAIRASAAIPGLFTPEYSNGRLLADGGIVNPLPVDVARELGADFVIAVSLLGYARDPTFRPESDQLTGWAERLTRGLSRHSAEPGQDPAVIAVDTDDASEIRHDMALLEVLSRATNLAQFNIASARLYIYPPDCLITVPLPDIGLLDFHRSAEAIAAGRAATRKALPSIRTALNGFTSVRARVARWLQRPPRV
jgi:NTE family protein